MTKLNPPAKVVTYDDIFDLAVRGVVKLADITPEVCQEVGLDPPALVLAMLLFAGHVSRTLGGRKKDFEQAAAQAFTDSADIFTVGQEKEQAMTSDKVDPNSRAWTNDDVVAVLRSAKHLVNGGWCQGDQAMKWVSAKTEPGGKKLVNCLVKDPYASRWSLVGAIDAAAPNEELRVFARDAAFAAVRDSGFTFVPGSIVPTVLVDYNDYGWAPPLPAFVAPPPPESTDAEVVAGHEKMVAELRRLYDTVTVPQWPRWKPNARTREEVLAVLDAAIRWAEEDVNADAETDLVDPGEGL